MEHKKPANSNIRKPPINIRVMIEQITELLPAGGSILDVIVWCEPNDNRPWPEQFNVGTRCLDEGERLKLFDDNCVPTPEDIVNIGFGQQRYDALCYEGYFQTDGSPINLFNSAISNLKSNGYFLCLCTMDKRDLKNSPFPPNLDYFCAIATRCGFLRRKVELLLSDGNRGHWMVVLQKALAMPRWHLTHMRDSGLKGFSRLFRDSFNSEPSADLWQWKYGGGRGRAVVVNKGDQMVAHYGSTLRAVSNFGQCGEALQICDVMVDPRERGVMTKTGAMFNATVTFNEIYLGLKNYAFAYGFPNIRHMALGKKLGLYSELARMAQVKWPLIEFAQRIDTRYKPLDAKDEKRAPWVNHLWAQMSKNLKGMIAIVRDWNYLTYRYFAHPAKRYSVLEVQSRWLRRLLGIIVLRREDNNCELVDLIAPLHRIPLLVDQARWISGEWGCDNLFCLVTEHEAPRFAGQAGVITQTDTVAAMMIWPGGQSIEQFKNKLWLMSGDMEFR